MFQKSKAFLFLALLSFPSYATNPCGLTWQYMGVVPDEKANAKPQGLTYINFPVKALLLSNHYEKTKPKVEHGSRVYYIPLSELPLTEEKSSKLGYFELSSDFKHVAGLAIDGSLLYGIDYRTNKIFSVSLFKALRNPMNVRVMSADLNGLSGVDFDCDDGKDLIGISEFKVIGKCKTNIYQNWNDCEKNKSNPVCSYRNDGYSQGLAFANVSGKKFLIESVNKGFTEGMGISYIPPSPVNPFPINTVPTIDEIRLYDVAKLRNGKNEKDSFYTKFNAPGPMVEDLAWDGEYLYTSDEMTMGLYRGKFKTNCE